MTDIAISRVHFPVTTLGPGRRLGLWMQGCSIRCPGCISADTWAAGHGGIAVADLIDRITPWLAKADGITVSGGEPFDQPAALAELLVGLRAASPANVLVYSGHPIEALDQSLRKMAGLIDALISDPYVHTLPQTKALRGSDNQRLHCLTPLGCAIFAGLGTASREQSSFDVVIGIDGTVWLAGIPSRADWARFQNALQLNTHAVATSEDASRRLASTIDHGDE